jgi:hypothetical protein
LKSVVHFVGDVHQHCMNDDDEDKGGNERHVIFDGRGPIFTGAGTPAFWTTSTATPRRSQRSWRAGSRRKTRQSEPRGR